MPSLHSVASRGNYAIGGINDMPSRPVVVGQELRLGFVIGLELADETDRGASESINVLVIVAHSEEAQAQVRIIQGSTSNSGDQGVFLWSDVLILIDQDPTIALDQCVALRFGL